MFNRTCPSVDQEKGFTTEHWRWLVEFQKALNTLAEEQRRRQSRVQALSQVTDGAPEAAYLPFNARLTSNKDWRQVDGTVSSWAVRFDRANDKFEIVFCAAGTDPIVWTTYLSFPASGTPTDPADIQTLALSDARYVQPNTDVTFDDVIVDDLEVNGALNHDGTTVGFYGVAPATRPASYTQTYATATRTHSNLTSATLTDSTGGSANTSVEDVTAAHDQTILNNNFADLTTQINALRSDLENAKQVMNQILDDLQGNGLLQ
jgi:hypothetical protein